MSMNAIINIDFSCHMLSKVEKEINEDMICMNSSEPLCGFNDKNRSRLSYDPLNCFNFHELNMTKDDDGVMNVNFIEDSQVM